MSKSLSGNYPDSTSSVYTYTYRCQNKMQGKLHTKYCFGFYKGLLKESEHINKVKYIKAYICQLHLLNSLFTLNYIYTTYISKYITASSFVNSTLIRLVMPFVHTIVHIGDSFC